MERTMRLNLTASKSKITGEEKSQTSQPTSFMITMKFIGIFLLVAQGHARLAQPFTQMPLAYLDVVEVTPEQFLKLRAKPSITARRE